jgi:hypothetical protein
MLDLKTLILAVAATLFGIAIGALLVGAFRTFFGGRSSTHGFLRPRDRRLGVVETASVDQKRKLVLIRRDDVEHLIITGGPDHREKQYSPSTVFQQTLGRSDLFGVDCA